MCYVKRKTNTNILNLSQIPEARLNSISSLSCLLKGASSNPAMSLHMKAAAEAVQTELGTFNHVIIVFHLPSSL